MCGGKKFQFGYHPLAMWKVDAKGAANVIEPDRGKVVVYVNCKECGYYMFFDPFTIGIL
jgi:hypothetical protein